MIRFLQVRKFSDCKTANNISAVVGCLFSSGFLLLGAFQVMVLKKKIIISNKLLFFIFSTHNDYFESSPSSYFPQLAENTKLHYLSSIMAFYGCIAFFWTQLYLVYRTEPPQNRYVTGPFMMSCNTIITLLLIPGILFVCIS